jgi:prepilin-type processing-associated H-X9-DG protein
MSENLPTGKASDNASIEPAPAVAASEFSLLDVLLTFVLVAASLGLCGAGGIVLAAFLVGVAALWVRRRWWSMGGLIALGVFIGSGLLLPSVGAPREFKHRKVCARNLEEIGLALRAYRNEHGRFPPSRVTDADGMPMHSWRVLILPYLGYEDLYKQYDFSQPWDGASNRKIVAYRPDSYECPTAYIFTPHLTTGNTTNYLAVTGPGSAWSMREVMGEHISDACAEKILVVETADSGIDWSQPGDVSLAEAVAGFCNPRGPKMPPPRIGFSHPVGVHALFADGSVRCIPCAIPPSTLKALLVSDGGQRIDANSLGLPALNTGEPVSLKKKDSRWYAYVSLAVLVASLGLLLIRPRPSHDATNPRSSEIIGPTASLPMT